MEYQSPSMPFVGGAGQQSNPWFTVANQFVPRNLHDVIRWARYITIQSPTTSEVIRKLATYPITDFLVDTEDQKLKTRYESVFKSFKLKESLQDAGFEFFTIGNVFLSIYFPIFRELECPTCKTRHNAKRASWATFKHWSFQGTCPVCKYKGTFNRIDTKSTSVEDMNLIKWTPEHIAVNNNPITGESEYYYRIPNSIKQKIQKGDSLFVNSVPWAFIEAVRFNQDFKFDKGSLFHLKNVSSGGTVEGIAVPPLLSLFSLVFYQATLRKANEAVATEYLNPLRVVFPQAQTGNSDPVIAMSMRNFRSHMEDALRRHKQDKNHIVISPTPVGYQPLGGDGRNLLVAQEIQQAEQSILLSLGVSQELLSGTTNWTSSSVGLRMMENLLTSYIGRIQDLIDWIIERVTAYLTMDKIPVTMVPFKLLDDDTNKNLLFELIKIGKISDTSLFEEIGVDWNKEQEKLKEETVNRARLQVETEYETDKARFIAAHGAGKDMENSEEYQTILSQAQGIAQQLVSADEATRRQFLGELQVQEYALYVLVKHILNQSQEDAVNQASVDQAQAQAQAAGQSANGQPGGDGSGPPPPGSSDSPADQNPPQG